MTNLADSNRWLSKTSRLQAKKGLTRRWRSSLTEITEQDGAVTRNFARRTVYVTLEHKEREFVPKIFLSRLLVNSGYRVYLGSSEAIAVLAAEAAPGIFFHKSTHPSSPFFRSLGHKFVFLDEEGGITTPRSSISDFCRWRYKTVNKDRQDMVLFPSQKFLAEVKALDNARGVEMAVTGWPRIDLWRKEFRALYETEVDKLAERYGKFFLLVSSFGATDESGFLHLIEKESPTDNFKSISEHKREGFYNYLTLVKDLAPMLEKGESIVIRPHPSESISGWKKLVQDLPNVVVVREGDVSPWIMASAGVLHYGSTSVTQTVLAEKPSLSFRVSERLGVTDTPSFELIPNVHEVEDAISILRGGEKSSVRVQGTRGLALDALRDFTEYDPNEYASEKIIAQLDRLEVEPIFRVALSRATWVKIFLLHLASGLRASLHKLGLGGPRSKSIVENLPGGVTATEVAGQLRRFDDILNLDSSWSVDGIAPYLVVIEPSLKT